YPIVLSFTAIAMVTALMVFVVPKLVEQFASIGQELPPLTRALIATSEFLGSYGIFVLVGLFVGLFAFLRALKNEGFRRRVDAGLLRLPLIGRLIREVSAARFARTMATLTASGSPVLQSLQAARDTVNNLIFRDAIHSLVVSVREGASLNGAMRHTNMFPPLVVYMAASGENSGELPDMLGKAADYLEAEFEAVTGVALNLLEPAIIILMGGIVMTIILAILLPILNLNTLALV
ncbi:MAG: type II secretion system F family protein, partial [Pseudomonadota bacterium]